MLQAQVEAMAGLRLSRDARSSVKLSTRSPDLQEIAQGERQYYSQGANYLPQNETAVLTKDQEPGIGAEHSRQPQPRANWPIQPELSQDQVNVESEQNQAEEQSLAQAETPTAVGDISPALQQ